MPTPSIQTLINDAQQVLNLDSISAVRSVVAVSLANANTGTPLNPNLTTQQLWNQFYQVVPRSKSDIESIIANQLMKFLFSPPAPGGVGADKQVIFNDGGVLAGSANFLFNKATNLLTVTGSATITGDLGVGTASPSTKLEVATATANTRLRINSTSVVATEYFRSGTGLWLVGSDSTNAFKIARGSNFGGSADYFSIGSATADCTWFDGAGGTRMTLNANGLGIGVTPTSTHNLSSAGPIGIVGTNSGTRTSYISNSGACAIYYTDGNASGFFADFGNLIIQPRTSAARSVVIATGSTTPVERAVVKSTGQVRFVPLASDPAGAEAGDVYYNSTSNKLKCYNGTTWNDLF